jgi:hypothetical protein
VPGSWCASTVDLAAYQCAGKEVPFRLNTFHFRVALGLARVARRGGSVACGRHRPSPPGRTRRNRGPSVRTRSLPRRSRGSPRDIRLASTPLGVFSTARITGPEIAARRTCAPRLSATLPGRAATGGHGRRPPHARALGRGGAGRPPPSEHADLMTAGRRARRWFRVDFDHRDPCRGD